MSVLLLSSVLRNQTGIHMFDACKWVQMCSLAARLRLWTISTRAGRGANTATSQRRRRIRRRSRGANAANKSQSCVTFLQLFLPFKMSLYVRVLRKRQSIGHQHRHVLRRSWRDKCQTFAYLLFISNIFIEKHLLKNIFYFNIIIICFASFHIDKQCQTT